jgi:hypothetical protein
MHARPLVYKCTRLQVDTRTGHCSCSGSKCAPSPNPSSEQRHDMRTNTCVDSWPIQAKTLTHINPTVQHLMFYEAPDLRSKARARQDRPLAPRQRVHSDKRPEPEIQRKPSTFLRNLKLRLALLHQKEGAVIVITSAHVSVTGHAPASLGLR